MMKEKTRAKKAGLSPGTLVYTGTNTGDIRIRLIDYDEKNFEENNLKNIEESFPFKATPTVTWINIDGIHDTNLIEKIGKHFDIHPIVLEDILTTNQRPKFEDFGSYFFAVLKMITTHENKIECEQVSLIVAENYIISFQEREGDVFDAIRKRIKNPDGKHRKMGTDYLAYSLVDAIVDNYFVILENYGERIEDIENELMENPNKKIVQTIHHLKGEMISLRKAVWPLRDMITSMERGDSKLIKQKTKIYLRDVYDHTIQIIESVETYRDMIAGMIEIYLTNVNNRMNEIMKVLTVIATIFIPLTFIVGIYGMNFKYMPELIWEFGYPLVLIGMLVVSLVMVVFFRRKKWI